MPSNRLIMTEGEAGWSYSFEDEAREEKFSSDSPIKDYYAALFEAEGKIDRDIYPQYEIAKNPMVADPPLTVNSEQFDVPADPPVAEPQVEESSIVSHEDAPQTPVGTEGPQDPVVGDQTDESGQQAPLTTDHAADADPNVSVSTDGAQTTTDGNTDPAS